MRKSEIHLFVLWPFALKARDEIVADISKHAHIIANFRASWPKGISDTAGYRRFYGTLLPDSAGKVKRAGGGPFELVVARLENPQYGWRMTQRGLEWVNLDMFNMKWRYREMVGGYHRVHGTISPDESRRDLMLMTGFTAEEWDSGKAEVSKSEVLPGQFGWRDMAQLFKFLGEVHPYAVMRNAKGLPEAFHPSHDDVDAIVANAGECAALIMGRKVKGGGAAAYEVPVAGSFAKFDLREVGDGYYDEAWERGMLARRVLNSSGIYELCGEDAAKALAYHVFFMKRAVAPDYLPLLGDLNASFDGLETYLAENRFKITAPKDKSVHLDDFRRSWRTHAVEVSAIFSLQNPRPSIEIAARRELSATMEGMRVKVIHCKGPVWPARTGFDIQSKFHEAAPEATPEPLRWQCGSVDGAFFIEADTGCERLSDALALGRKFGPAEAKHIAESAAAIIAALDKTGIVHRDITAENLRVGSDGALLLCGFHAAVVRKNYKTEGVHFRRDLEKLLVPLGGDGVARPGEWNDRHALAVALKPLAELPEVAEEIAKLEAEAAAGKGTLRTARRKLSFRLLRVYLKTLLKGAISPKRRKSGKFKRTRAFTRRALFGF